MIQTSFGAVPLRKPRSFKRMTPHAASHGGREPVEIKKNWLKGGGSSNAKTEEYRITVKQAMMIASLTFEMEDLSIMQIDPQTGTWRTPQFILKRRQELDTKLQDMVSGKGNVARRSLTAKENLQKQVHKLKKHVLTKRSAKCGSSRTRWFTIESGRLHVYKSDGQHAKVRKTYSLNNARCTYEYSKMPNMPSGESFMVGKDHRICLLATERPQGPMYLYPDETDPAKAAKQVKNWERACKMSKYLQSESDKGALQTVVQKVSGNVMTKGWQALFDYAKEISETKKTVKTFAMRLMKVEHARGWNKARLVYKQRKQTEQLRQDQQAYAAKFLASRMQSINTQNARPINAVRQHMMTTIQNKFRHFRQEKIFDRSYAFGGYSRSRIQQAKQGVQMDCAFQSLTCEDALKLALERDGEKAMRTSGDVLKSKKSSYSESNLSLHRAHCNASDSLTMLSFSEIEAQPFFQDKAEHKHLAMGEWASFVNFDQISSVIVHCERQMATSRENDQHHELHPDMTSGVWFCINGPRVCWSRRIHHFEDRETKAHITDRLGAADGMEVGSKLAGGQSVKILTIEVTVKATHIPAIQKITKPSNTKDDTMSNASTASGGNSVPDTYLVLNILGRQFRGGRQSGDRPQYTGNFNVECPVGSDEGALAGLDHSQVGVDIMDADQETCLWAGKLPLWKVFAPDNPSAALMEGVRHLKARLDAIRSKGVDEEQAEMLIPLNKTMSGGSAHATKKMPLYHCYDTIGENRTAGNIDLEVRAVTRDSRTTDKRPISPELQGVGLVTSLYSTHRGAWLNPAGGMGKFSADSVASFAEFRLLELQFPDKDPADATKVFQYYVEAKCCGTNVCTKAVTRSRKTWSQLIRTSETKLNFGDKKLYVPIPPGQYCKGDVKVELGVFRVAINELPTLTFRELLSFNNRPRSSAPSVEKVYHSTVSLDSMFVDQQRSDGNTIVMSKLPEAPSEASPGRNVWGQADTAAVLKCHVVLRDRDYVRMALTNKGEEKTAVCIGDNAMLVCEEPLSYPKSDLEYRHRFLPDEYDQSKSKGAGGKWDAKLRDPSMSHEYELSRLGKMEDGKKYQFRQKHIPASYDDVIPHKFMLPPDEIEFQKAGCPGTWWRIMDDLVKAKGSKEGSQPTIRKTPQHVVETMSHVTKKVPVVVLAVYASAENNPTCDVELSPSFVFEWETKPDKHYTLPGSVLIKEFQDASDEHVRAAPPGTGDVGQRRRRRVVLKDVPLSYLSAVHSASFNVYDAAYGTTEEALQTPPSVIKNGFNPRASSETMQFMGPHLETRGGYSISAGPLPADCGASAAYEWSLYLRAPSESDLYHFLTMLRHCVRMDFYNQTLKMREFHQRYVKTGNLKYQVGTALSMASGYLEVVLMEAKRLQPKRVQKFKDNREMVIASVKPTHNPFVTFRLLRPSDPKIFSPSEHGPIKTGDVIRIIMDGWDGKNPGGEDFSIDFLSGQGNVALHWAVLKQENKIRRNDFVGKRAEAAGSDAKSPAGWGTEEPVQCPAQISNGTQFSIDFERCPGRWQISINESRDPGMDFPHEPRDVHSATLGYVENVKLSANCLNPKIYIITRQELVVRGSRQQQSPVINGTSSPNWARLEELQSAGGWVFRSSPLDPKSMSKLVFELQVMNMQGMPFPVGIARMSVTGEEPSEGGAPSINLCDPKMPFQNLWLPLNTIDETGKLVPNASGEVHIMTRWVASQQQSAAQRRMPKTARAFFKQELAPKLIGSSLREPVYELLMRATYNPNIAKEIAHPLTRSELIGQHAEELFNTSRYLICCEGRQSEAWSQFIDELPNWVKSTGVPLQEEQANNALLYLADCRHWLLNDPRRAQHAFEIDELLRRGIPPQWRIDQNVALWHSITKACHVQNVLASANGGDMVLTYLALVEHSNLWKSDAMLQLQEDMVTAASWETSPYPTVVDTHLNRLKRARNVCAALITFSYELANAPQVDVEVPGRNQGKKPARVVNVAHIKTDNSNQAGEQKENVGVAYCESLLVIAFFMLLPQIGDDKESKMLRSGSRSFSKQFSKVDNAKPTNDAQAASKAVEDHAKGQNKVLEELEEESRVFTLMYTLIGAHWNQAFKDYYAVPPKASDGTPMIADHRGTSEDLVHLNSIVSRYDRELWIHMTGLGFHLSSVFHGAFMRLFAFCMPTAAVFRFWDLLFSESTRVDAREQKKSSKPARHSLIDLAYGVLKFCRGTLLKCESEREFRDCLVGALEALYDPSTMIEITTEAERELWEGLPTKFVGVIPEHVRDMNINRDYYQRFLRQFKDQNEILAQVVKEITIDISGRSNNNNAQPGQQQIGNAAQYDTRLKADNIGTYVIPPIRKEFQQEIEANTQQGGMFRKTTERICELGPQMEAGFLSTAKYTMWSLMGQNVDMLFQTATGHRQEGHLVFPLPALPRCVNDPASVPRSEWERKVPIAVGVSWNTVLGPMYDRFKKDSGEHVSLIEIFTAMILCCKGTVGEKALALFKEYSFREPERKLRHIIPVLHHARAVVEKVEGNQEREKGASFAPPDDEQVAKDTALHFQIYTHTQGDDMLLGEVYVQSLHPFIWAGMGSVPPQPYTIWGTKMRLPPGMVDNTARAKDDPSKVRPYIGDLQLGIKWMPGKDENKPEVGQIGIRVFSIRFDSNRVEAAKWKNPWIKVTTYDENLHPQSIPRWDPRNALRKGANAMTAGLAYGGAFKGHIEFDETMRRDALGVLHHRWGSGDHGYDYKEGLWKWNDKWGDQYSVCDFAFRKDFVQQPKDLKNNTISIQACRLITLAILRRSLYYISNRQAMLVADAAFSRAGVVPAIIDAIIVKGSTINHEYATPTQLKRDYEKQGKDCHCVRRQLIIEAEKQCNKHLGRMNLWDPNYEKLEKTNLSDLSIHDPYPLQSKTLWIRYCRSGDGERDQVKIHVDGSGSFTPEPILFDMPEDKSMKSKAQMTLSKDEFVSCILGNPMISESLRQLSSSDCSTDKLPKWRPIKLNVTIADPTQQGEDDDLFDVMNVRQSILLEVWDKDLASKDDFLGEAWLPPLGSIGSDQRNYILPVREANKSLGGTRPDPKKDLDLDKHCTGDLHVRVAWKLPAEEPGPELGDETKLEVRVKREEKLHTGLLYLKILKAEQLRVADVRRKHGSDPYVIAYVRNDCYEEKSDMAWRKNQVTGLLDPLFKTSVKKATINPEWNEETTVQLQTGAFEKRTKQRWQIHLTKRGRQEQQDKHALDVIKDQDELKLYFGDDDRNKVGARHDVQVYMGDTIREFKAKLVLAAQKEALACRRHNDEQSKQLATKYHLVQMTFKHVVTVFMPSERLRSLSQQRRNQSQEYGRLFRVEENDPSSWKPLDPIRSFNHYSTFHGFGGSTPQTLRVSEGTEDYKLRNHRFRVFEEERLAMGQRIEDTNKEDKCFGYGVYTHRNDGDSSEWRAVLVDRPESAGITSRDYKASWLYVPSLVDSSQAAAAAAGLGDQTKYDLAEDKVLLAPHQPKVLGSGHFEHQEFLAQAVDLAKAGKTNQEIAKILNEKLMRKFELAKDQEQAEGSGDKKKPPDAPPPITVTEVTHHLSVLNAETDGDTPSQSGHSTPRQPSKEPAGRPQPSAATITPAPAKPPPSNAPPSSAVPSVSGPSGPSTGGQPSRTGPGGPGGPSGSGGPTGPSRGPPTIGGPRIAPSGGPGTGGPQRG